MQYVVTLKVIDGHKIDVWVLIEKLYELLYFSIGEYRLKYLALSETTPDLHDQKYYYFN